MEYVEGEPVAGVTVSNPDPDAHTLPREISALLDSGSEITCLLEEQIAALGLTETSFTWITTATGTGVEVPLYVVHITINGMDRKTIQVAGINGSSAIVGRNLLDHATFCFDGPSQAWHFS